MKPNTEEVELRGSWNFTGATLNKDDVAKRIDWLISNYLVKIISDASGWCTLYQDPEDKRYWELTYPESDLHGGGPPLLKYLSKEDAHDKYKI